MLSPQLGSEIASARASPLPQLDTVKFRQRLAGLIDESETVSPETREELVSLAVRFTALLPTFYGEGLDRMKMWDRIGSGLQAASAKTANGDVGAFAQSVMEHIQSEPGRVAANDDFADVLSESLSLSFESRQALLLTFKTHLVSIIVYARKGWTIIKDERKAARADRNGVE